MSSPPPPYVPPGTSLRPPPGGPRRRRPHVGWFVLGGVLVLLAPAVFAASLFLTLRPLAQEDGVFPADGQPHALDLPGGARRALFLDQRSLPDVRCEAVDSAGAPVGLRPVSGEFTYNRWRAVDRFDTGAGDVSFTCESAGGRDRVRVAQAPSTGGLVGGILVGVLVPIVLGLTGLTVLVVTTVLFATGRPRRAAPR